MSVLVAAVILTFGLFLCNGNAAAQTPTIPDLKITKEDKGTLQDRQLLIHRKPRFLGWKFAGRAGVSASEWPRRSVQQELLAETSSLPTSLSGMIAPASSTLPFGNPGFSSRTHLPTGYIPTAIVEGDFNEDGNMDVAIANGGDNTLYVLLGKGDGTFQVPQVLYTQGQSPDWLAATSLRSNGHLDLIVSDGDSNSLEVFLGRGDGTFQAGGQLALPQTPTFVLAGDFNKDGKEDVVVGFVVEPGPVPEPQFEVLLGDGAGGFSGRIVPPPIFVMDPTPTGWIASGDLDKYGYLDLVTTISGGAAITYLNQAGKAFAKGDPFGPSDGPMVVELGDMDEDGCLDAVELGTLGYLTIAKGTCDGNFVQSIYAAEVGDIDPAVKVVDVNGDGHLDVVASAAFYQLAGPGFGAEAGYLVSVLNGDGKGGFSPAQTYRGGWDSFSLVVADFNGDNKPEIITADSFENQASFFLNDGNGNYDRAQGEVIGYLAGVANAPNSTVSMQAVDVNGDGKADLLLIEDGMFSSQPSQVTVLLNDGTGKFMPPVRSPITVGPTVPYPEFVVGAFRDPMKPDLVYISKFTSQNIVAFFPGHGDGTFGAPAILATLPWPARVVAGDFNNDGLLDFVVYGGNSDTTSMLEVDVFLGRGDGAFKQLPSQTFPAPNTGGIQQIFARDLNHDGKLDLLIGNNTNGGWTDTGDDLVEFLGNGDGTFKTPTILIPHFGAVAVVDVNRDGLPDLIQGRDPSENVGANLFGKPAVTVYLGQSDGTFVQQPTYNLPGAIAPTLEPVLIGDFDGDGIPDIAVRYLRDGNGLWEPRLRVLQGAGDGTFVVTGDVFQLPGYSDPFVGADFDGDGKTDLVELAGYTSSFHTLPAAAAPSLAIHLNSNPILDASGSATVTLDKPASAAEVVLLGASDSAVQMPASLNFAAGQQSQSFPFALGSGFDAGRVLALYATMGTETAVAYGSKPNPNATVGVAASLNQSSVSITPSETIQLSLALGSQGGYYGVFAMPQCIGLPSGASCNFSGGSLEVPVGGSAVTTFTLTTTASTPFGLYPVSVNSTDGFFQASSPLQLGIGDFSLIVNPSLIVMGPSGSASAAVTSTSTNGINEFITLTCLGLPTNVQCGQSGNSLNANGGLTSLGIGGGPFAAQDYPFQVKGSANIASHSFNTVLRVGDFTASLDKTSATLSAGQSTSFNVILTSINHYTSNITVSCQSPSNALSCIATPSPTSLTDGGTVSVQLTATAAKTTPSMLIPVLQWDSSWKFEFALLCLIAAVLFRLRRQRRIVSVLAVLVISTAIIACGGGGGVTQPSPSPPPPTPQTVKMTVLASAASTSSDFNNQKALGPIVITLQ
jgi:FG-GAP-like repeat